MVVVTGTSMSSWTIVPVNVLVMITVSARAGAAIEAESRRFGAFWDGEQDRGRNAVQAMPGHTIVNLSAEQEGRFELRHVQQFHHYLGCDRLRIAD
jgi:hypothetical protein